MHVPAGYILPQYAKALAGSGGEPALAGFCELSEGFIPMHVPAGYILPQYTEALTGWDRSDAYRRAEALPQYIEALGGWGRASFSWLP